MTDSITRFHIDFTREEIDASVALMKRCGLEKQSDLYNNAIAVLEWAAEQVQKGNTIAAIDRSTAQMTEYASPALSAAAASAKSS